MEPCGSWQQCSGPNSARLACCLPAAGSPLRLRVGSAWPGEQSCQSQPGLYHHENRLWTPELWESQRNEGFFLKREVGSHPSWESWPSLPQTLTETLSGQWFLLEKALGLG